MGKKPKTHSSSALSKPEWGLLLLSVVLSGFLMALSLHAGHQPYVSFVVLIPIFVAVRVCLPWQGATCGVVWGLTLLTVSYAGIGPSISLTPATVLALIALPAGYVWFGTALTTRIGFSPFVLAVGWMGVEAALSPTIALNHNEFLDRAWMSWFGSMVAPLLVGFCIALINAVFLELAVCCYATRTGLMRPARSTPESIVASLESFISPLLSVLSARHSRAPPFSRTLC